MNLKEEENHPCKSIFRKIHNPFFFFFNLSCLIAHTHTRVWSWSYRHNNLVIQPDQHGADNRLCLNGSQNIILQSAQSLYKPLIRLHALTDPEVQSDPPHE